MIIGHLYIFFRETPIQILCPFFFLPRFIEGMRVSTCGEGLLSVWRAAAWQAAGERGLQNLGLLESVALGSTMPKTFGSEHGRVAGPAFMLHLIPAPR